jgi:hypothetical protein
MTTFVDGKMCARGEHRSGQQKRMDVALKLIVTGAALDNDRDLNSRH